MGQKGSARRAQPQPASRPDEQVDTQIVFKLPQLPRDGWLSHMNHIGSRAHRPFFGDRDEVPQRPQLHAYKA